MKKVIEAIKNFIGKLSEKTRLSKKMLAAAVLLVAGIAALLASELADGKSTEAALQTQLCTVKDTAEYERELEERLTSIISAIEGAGNTRVMVTLESGSEDIYLHDYDYGENISPSGKSSIERKDEYVIVDGSAGEGGIIVRVAEPRVRGVAVVCEGGGSELVRQQVTQAVTALLDISSARVSVAKMN